MNAFFFGVVSMKTFWVHFPPHFSSNSAANSFFFCVSYMIFLPTSQHCRCMSVPSRISFFKIVWSNWQFSSLALPAGCEHGPGEKWLMSVWFRPPPRESKPPTSTGSCTWVLSFSCSMFSTHAAMWHCPPIPCLPSHESFMLQPTQLLLAKLRREDPS